MLAGLDAGGGDQVGVARNHQLVQRGRLLHIGQHEVGLQAVAGQLHRVVHGIESEFRAVNGDKDSGHGNSFCDVFDPV